MIGSLHLNLKKGSKLTVFSDEGVVFLVLRHFVVVGCALLVEELEGPLYKGGMVASTSVLTVHNLRCMFRPRGPRGNVWCVELGYLYLGLKRLYQVSEGYPELFEKFEEVVAVFSSSESIIDHSAF